MAVTDTQPGWDLEERIAFESSITGESSPTLSLHSESLTEIIDTNDPITQRQMATGQSMPRSENFVQGRPDPQASWNLPFTAINWALAATSLLQNVNHTGTKYVLTGQPSLVNVRNFFSLHQGKSSATTAKTAMRGRGGKVSQMTLRIPAVQGSDPGDVRIASTLMFANAIRTATRLSNGGSHSRDTQTPLTTRDFALAINTATKHFISGSVTFNSNTTKSQEAAATPGAMFLGPLTISGDLKVYTTTANDDPYDLLVDAHEAKTATELKLTATGGHFVSFDALIGPPQNRVESDIRVTTFAFQGFADDGTQPVIEAILATAFPTWT